MIFIRNFKRYNPLLISILIGVGLLFSYPFLSHDLFNYLFDAKIVTFYHQNPYILKALDFPSDPWLRFMHWTHRTYPYGPSFLFLTLVPSAHTVRYGLPSTSILGAWWGSLIIQLCWRNHAGPRGVPEKGVLQGHQVPGPGEAGPELGGRAGIRAGARDVQERVPALRGALPRLGRWRGVRVRGPGARARG